MPRKKIELIGKRFGRLVVVREAGRAKNRAVLWECKCDCGNISIVQGAHLRGGSNKSCGCLLKEGSHKTHGKTHAPEYSVWAHIIQRCTNPKNKSYKYYGGRGIAVCDRWRNSFEVFYEDMGPKPGPEYSIDRINNDLGYYKENCEWARREKQSQNRRNMSNNTSGISGVNWHKRHEKWAARISKNNKRIHLGYFETKEEAIAVRKEAELKYW